MKALVCLSGGLDSTVSLLWAEKEYESVDAVFFNYGQKALEKERKASRYFAGLVEAGFLEIDLKFLGEVSSSALNKVENLIPQGTLVDINSIEVLKETAKAVWVPNRNGLFINAAASIAEAKKIDHIVLGFNLEEAQTFLDNSKQFIDDTNKALESSTRARVRVVSPTVNLNKVDIVKLGKKLDVNFQKLWPCYKNDEEICGACESCKRYLKARKESGL